MSDEEEEETKDDVEDSPDDKLSSLRRSKRNSNHADKETVDEDTDALSELETLAKMGRTEGFPPPSSWFSERSLETRLHHIAHTVQNCEWPASGKTHRASDSVKSAHAKAQDENKNANKKQHIAIDVETERAKLHALLSSPHPAHAGGRDRASEASPVTRQHAGWDRDDASSDSGSRRSTPAPPPAHQRAPHASTPAPVDLSAPLDLSEVQDFSMGRRTPASEPPSTPIAAPALTPTKSRLDDTLSKLMKRKNVVSSLSFLCSSIL